MLRIVFFKKIVDGNVVAPVENYLDKLADTAEDLRLRGKSKEAEKFMNLFNRLLSLIKHAMERNGQASLPESKKLHGYPLCELRQKNRKRLIRIFYFAYLQEKLVLLHVFEKKEGEETPKVEIEEAYHNYKLYISDPKTYEC